MIEKAYKAVRIEDGKYLSIFCGSDVQLNYCARSSEKPSGSQLEYKPGEITRSESLNGIYLFQDIESLKQAYLVQEKYKRSSKQLAILECIPIGRDVLVGSETECHFPAVYVVKEVWREELKQSEPVWDDVTTECKIVVTPGSCGAGYLFTLYHKEQWLWEIGLDSVGKPFVRQYPENPKYKIEKASRGFDYFYLKVLKRRNS